MHLYLFFLCFLVVSWFSEFFSGLSDLISPSRVFPRQSCVVCVCVCVGGIFYILVERDWMFNGGLVFFAKIVPK